MLNRVIKIFGSLKLTVVCLTLAMVLVFIGTIAQVDQGLYSAQNRYFRSLFVYWQPAGAEWKLPIFPGGYLVGALLLLNLITAYAERFGPRKGRLGLLLAHAGIVLLICGQFGTDMLSVESSMRLIEGSPKNFSESSSHHELAVIDVSPKDYDEVLSIPEGLLARPDRADFTHSSLPFTVRVVKYYPNARLARRGEKDTDPPPATQGFGPSITLTPVPPTVKMDERNLPAAVLELLTPQGSLGTWLVALVLDEAQTVTVGNKPYRLMLRATRFYKPFSITLLKFSHDKYHGTDIPKNFSSRIRLQHPATSEDREVLIYMNNPLRYAGETYYQASFDPNDPRVSILQVVRNPSWLTPYFACLLVSAGLVIQFMSHLLEFVRNRRTA